MTHLKLSQLDASLACAIQLIELGLDAAAIDRLRAERAALAGELSPAWLVKTRPETERKEE